ncbi:Isoleucine--tRNA ligase [Mactra antiquata]
MDGRRRVGMYRESPGSDIVKQGFLKKLKTMKKKFFVLRSTSSSGPSRLDYYDSEKKFKTNHPPKKSYLLHTFFNINKRTDTKQKFVIAIYLPAECFSVIAENQVEQEEWINYILEYQNEYLPQDTDPRPHYEYVWQGTVKHKSPASCSKVSGQFRLCLSEKAVTLVRFSEYKPAYQFQFKSVRRCGHSDNFFFMGVGRSAVTGTGEIWMQVDETSTAQNMHDAVLNNMTASRAAEEPFRRRSNTGNSTPSHHGGEIYNRKRATSESHRHGSPRPARPPYSQRRPMSTVVYTPRNTQLNVDNPVPLGSSPSAFDPSLLLDKRVRSDSMGSRSSHTSHHSDMIDHMFDNSNPTTPLMSPEGSFISGRSLTPDASNSITEEDKSNSQDTSEYLPMTPGQRSLTPSPTRGLGHFDRSGDYLPMTPGQRSGTPSPTRFTERPASAGSHDSGHAQDGYMDMTPGSSVSSPATNTDCSFSMAMTPPKSNSSNTYMDMTPTTPVLHNNNGYIDMNPGQRTPTDPGPGYVIMDGAWVRPSAPIAIRSNKEPGYMDMGPASQPLPTVKESGSGEAYLPMSPSNMSTMSSDGLKPAKVVSYLSDDSMSGEFPKRAYSVGSRPISKQPFRVHQTQEVLRRQPLDSSKSSSAPHLIVQKSRSQFMDTILRNSHHDGSYPASPLSQSVKSDDSDSFMEMEFYRPRTASDSYGCRPRSSSFGKQFIQGHRPRSSSYGQGAKGTISKLASGLRTDSYESVRTTSQELSTKHRSQESLGMVSSSSRNSSSESLKKLGEASSGKKTLLPGDYMDMSYDKRKTPSPNIQAMASPKADPAGYMDMTLGTGVPKSRGMSPGSSTHSLPSSAAHSLGSSPASSIGHGHSEKITSAKIIKPSGKAITQKHSYKASPMSDNQLKVATARLKLSDKRSPSSSGKESEDESYVPFQPSGTSSFVSADDSLLKLHGQAPYEIGPKSHPGLKVQHGYSKSHDSAMRSSEGGFFKSDKPSKSKKDDKNKVKSDEHGKGDLHKSKSVKEKKSDRKGSSSDKDKYSNVKGSEQTSGSQSKCEDASITDNSFASIPDDDLFSNKMFKQNFEVKVDSPDSPMKSIKSNDSDYMKYCPSEEQSTLQDIDKSSGSKLNESKRVVEREYCEIDFPAKEETGCLPKFMESDYMMSDPANLPRMDDFQTRRQSKEVPKSLSQADDNFSYMDFDPKTVPKDEALEKKEEVVKSPISVKSFLAHSISTDETDQHPSEETTTSQESNEGCIVAEKGSRCLAQSKDNDNDKNGCGEGGAVKMCASSDDKMCANSQDYVMGCSSSIKDIPSNGKSVKSVVNTDGGQCMKVNPLDSDSNCANTCKQLTVISDGVACEIEDKDKESENVDTEVYISHGKYKQLDKLVVKQISPQNNQPVHDEGYCDLDFRDKDNILPNFTGSVTPRSERTPSGNSDRESGRGILDSTTSEDSLPCPETPVSYISDDTEDLPMPETPQSFISDDSNSSSASSKELSSPFKSPLGGRSSVPVGGKMPGFGLASFGLCGDSLRKSLPSTRTHGSNNQVFFTPISRQTSVPVSQSVSPRLSGEIAPQLAYRSRKASGPAVLSTQYQGNGNGSKLNSSGSLEPVVAGQELHKQKSMPCMNVPLQKEKLQDSDHVDHVHSRHSFTDLSQYEEMTFPGNNLSANSQPKCSSQQQLSGEPYEPHYADLDLKGSTENVDGTSPRIIKSRHPSSLDDVSREPVQYAEIDHLKTEKMKNSNEKDVMFYVN